MHCEGNSKAKVEASFTLCQSSTASSAHTQELSHEAKAVRHADTLDPSPLCGAQHLSRTSEAILQCTETTRASRRIQLYILPLGAHSKVIWCKQFSSLALLMLRACFVLHTNNISWVNSLSRREAAAQPHDTTSQGVPWLAKKCHQEAQSSFAVPRLVRKSNEPNIVKSMWLALNSLMLRRKNTL